MCYWGVTWKSTSGQNVFEFCHFSTKFQLFVEYEMCMSVYTFMLGVPFVNASTNKPSKYRYWGNEIIDRL